ncbi:unnamed protein product [Penicillium salamii]|uniref:Exoribonuclease phosphorolytic domain-containing protein n=1 Tax=Penicillium salamii TaxID=1612424 RepID=A0A9W4INR5_9EURO|nr:unnamed protein product [Penicillium salamii]CAG8339786.1 unnamed protein product [Penicillium salamii]CAG8421065.1 unnamed protein product [Penicillium salamii]
MPLDTSTTYPLTRLRLDGRRWNELRLLQAQISTNPASSGSSYLSMGNTSIMCSVHGPAEGRRGDGAAGSGQAIVEVDVNVAGFAGVDRRRKAGGSDRQSTRIASTLRSAFQSHLHTYLYPHSTISIHVSILSADGSVLAAAINACTLALVDAGIPMPGLLTGCTAGMSGSASTPRDPRHDELDPLLDVALPEEQELPFLTVGTTTVVPVGENNMDEDEEAMKVSVFAMESKVHSTYLETMTAVGIDGCSQIRELLEGALICSLGLAPYCLTVYLLSLFLFFFDASNPQSPILISFNMGGMNMTATATSAMTMTTSMGSGMSMGMGNHTEGMHECKMSMYWNWYTIGSCFLAKSWHVTSRGMFAGSCIGVICLVISLEFLRRAGREYDGYLVRQARLQQSSHGALLDDTCDDNAYPNTGDNIGIPGSSKQATSAATGDSVTRASVLYRPSLVQHTVRSLIHMVQFAVAYIVMLLAMYYNGYIIICIFIGAFLGAFFFAWEPINLSKE